MRTSIRSLLVSACLGALLAAGCTVSAPGTAAPDASRDAASEAAANAPAPAPDPVPTPTPAPDQLIAEPVPTAAPPMSDPLPPERMPSPVAIDYSCRADADCAVKNVGNCCGMLPACVNKDSRTDPAAVQAECARSGLSSVCGFVDIQACSCVSNRCEAQSSAGGVTR